MTFSYTATLAVLLLLTSCFTVTAQPSAALPQLGKSPLQEVIRAMSTEEKIQLVVGMGFQLKGIPPGILPPMDPEDAAVPEKVPGAAGRTHAVARLGIPSLTLSDGPAGIRINPIRNNDSSATYYATAFPVATLLAATWDVDLVKQVGAAFGNEAKEYGIDLLLAPGMNIQRNPLGGRNFEYYSEDPVVAGHMAAAFVKGVQSNGVGTSIKHFAANNQEFNRMQLDTKLSERALREIYLKGFRIAVQEAAPWTVMSAYNLINGTIASQSRELLTTILRGEWGFKGMVMSDWFAGKDAAAQLMAGNDLLMPGTVAQRQAIQAALDSGKLSIARLDENVAAVLGIVLQSPSFKKRAYNNRPALQQHALLARRAAAEGMVLLKNERTLPVSGKKIALFGNPSYHLVVGGTGSGDVNKAYVVSLQQGLANAGYLLDTGLTGSYTRHIAAEKARQPPPTSIFSVPPPLPELPLEEALLQRQAAAADMALLTLTRNAGEGGDRKVENDFTLTNEEQAMIRAIARAFHRQHKKLVIVLNVGGVTETASWRDAADAILLAWQPGQEGGNAIVDVLSGKTNPSGRLAASFPVQYADVPSAGNFPGKELPNAPAPPNPMMGRASEVTYDEGVYVGYRYYNTFHVSTAYPFGYGLSYTQFSYSKPRLSATVFHHQLTVTVTVTNTGKRPGKEVVQLYLAAPAGKQDKPEQELKAFAKTRLLAPGQGQTLSFTLLPADLASFDSGSSSWMADAGTYTVHISRSAEQPVQTATFQLQQAMVVEKDQRVLVPAQAIPERKRP